MYIYVYIYIYIYIYRYIYMDMYIYSELLTGENKYQRTGILSNLSSYIIDLKSPKL